MGSEVERTGLVAIQCYTFDIWIGFLETIIDLQFPLILIT